jgi:hypothetical protein
MSGDRPGKRKMNAEERREYKKILYGRRQARLEEFRSAMTGKVLSIEEEFRSSWCEMSARIEQLEGEATARAIATSLSEKARRLVLLLDVAQRIVPYRPNGHSVTEEVRLAAGLKPQEAWRLFDALCGVGALVPVTDIDDDGSVRGSILEDVLEGDEDGWIVPSADYVGEMAGNAFGFRVNRGVAGILKAAGEGVGETQ